MTENSRKTYEKMISTYRQCKLILSNIDSLCRNINENAKHDRADNFARSDSIKLLEYCMVLNKVILPLNEGMSYIKKQLKEIDLAEYNKSMAEKRIQNCEQNL